MKKASDRKRSKSVRSLKAMALSSNKLAAGHEHANSAPDDAYPAEDIRDKLSMVKREHIIATAVNMFYNDGLSNTSLEAVAKRMNVTKPFIYAHFKSKSDLVSKICSRGISASLEALNGVVASEDSAAEKVRALVRDFTVAVLKTQQYTMIYTREVKHLSEEDNEAINAMRRRFHREFCALLNDGVAAGEFVVDDVAIASLAITGMVAWACTWYRQNGRLTLAETAEKMAGLALAMIHAKPRRRNLRSGAKTQHQAVAASASSGIR